MVHKVTSGDLMGSDGSDQKWTEARCTVEWKYDNCPSRRDGDFWNCVICLPTS